MKSLEKWVPVVGFPGVKFPDEKRNPPHSPAAFSHTSNLTVVSKVDKMDDISRRLKCAACVFFYLFELHVFSVVHHGVMLLIIIQMIQREGSARGRNIVIYLMFGYGFACAFTCAVILLALTPFYSIFLIVFIFYTQFYGRKRIKSFCDKNVFGNVTDNSNSPEQLRSWWVVTL